jgi:hypothetical protein
MDAANKQNAVVAEVTQGTIVASPGFKVLRDTGVTGTPQRGDARSPERRADRMEHNSVKGINVFNKSISAPWVRDDGLDILWTSAFGADWSANVVKNGSTKMPFTLEEKYEGGVTDPYRRLRGCIVDSAAIAFRMDGSPGTVTFALAGLEEETQAAAIAGATYAAPNPGYDPVSGVNVLVNDLFGITSPKLMNFNVTIKNNLRQQYGMGSASPWGIGTGIFEVEGQVQFYFSQLPDYSTFAGGPVDGLTLDLTIGSQANQKDRLVIPAARVSNPNIDDPVTGDHMQTLNFRGRYFASDGAAIKLTRLVA